MYSTIIPVQVLSDHIDDPEWVILDCRYDLFDKSKGYRTYLDGHIPRAVYVDLHDDLSGPPVTDCGRHPLPNPDSLVQLFSSLGISGAKQVLVYDASFGSVAARLWWMLRYMGHEFIAVLDGGWQAWQAAGLEQEQQQRRNGKRQFVGNNKREWLVTQDEVLQQTLLIDSREPSRYTGEQEPIDPVAGHIPGAVNHFWKKNLTEGGCFLPVHLVKQKLVKCYGDSPENEVVFYCGSGVTACQNILAAAYAGLDDPKLYVGSWSEWCSDPNLPIATGNN